MQQQKAVKLVVVGDGSVGKTCLLLSYATDKFPQDYIPTVFENYTTQVKIDNEDYALTLWDTAGQEGYEKLRAVSYQGADIILITFSVVDINSFENAMHKWLNEIVQNIPQNAIILFVGSKTDLREYNKDFVSIQVANKTLTNMGYEYRECSALTQDGLKEVFSYALTLYLRKQLEKSTPKNSQIQKKKQRSCQLI